ncbi:class A sortase [Enterococcus termitis]|uniref:Class A sortase n=2 Tax=Enterococcus termitis TaxID=332950 RepID=A0A1E5GBG1_9ENTE|nr:class C sortase [Enterococcus termitis]OEG09981.1 class A sortase [Enterococcus termitis]
MKQLDQAKQPRRMSVLLILAALMIVGGMLTLLYPIVGNYLADRERSAAVSSYDESLKHMSKSQQDEQMSLAQKYNEMIYKQQNGKRAEKINYNKIINEKGVMGTLDIPALNIEHMPFYHGTDFRTLDKGLGHYEPTSIPVGGKNTRSVISGHSGLENQVLFTEINSLEVGDLFFINILGKRLAYQIESFEEVLPKESDRIKVQKGKDMVTLLTCTPPGVNTYRLLVNGVRIPYKEALDKKIVKRNTWSYQRLVIGSLIIGLFIGSVLYMRYRYLKKKLKIRNKKIRKKTRKQLKQLFMFTKVLFILLIICMITVLGFSIYGYTQMSTQAQMEEIPIGEHGELASYNLSKAAKGTYTEQDISSVNIGNYAEAKVNFKQTVNEWGIGKLMIPSEGVDLPILAGMNNENLMNGAATFSKEQQMGKGNYVLLAHNIEGQDVLFHRTKNLKNGDEIFISDFKDVYSYKVTMNKVITDTEVSVLEKPDKGNKPQITLLRCEGGIGTIYRRVVKGELTGIQSIDSMSSEEVKPLGMTVSTPKKENRIVDEEPVKPINAVSMKLTSRILSEPLQTILPMFLLLVIPILLLNILR